MFGGRRGSFSLFLVLLLLHSPSCSSTTMDVRATAAQANGNIPNGTTKQNALVAGADRHQIIDDQKNFTSVAGAIHVLPFVDAQLGLNLHHNSRFGSCTMQDLIMILWLSLAHNQRGKVSRECGNYISVLTSSKVPYSTVYLPQTST